MYLDVFVAGTKCWLRIWWWQYFLSDSGRFARPIPNVLPPLRTFCRIPNVLPDWQNVRNPMPEDLKNNWKCFLISKIPEFQNSLNLISKILCNFKRQVLYTIPENQCPLLMAFDAEFTSSGIALCTRPPFQPVWVGWTRSDQRGWRKLYSPEPKSYP